MTFSVRVYYCSFILVVVFDILFTTISHVYLALHVGTHYACRCILCILCILRSMYSL